ncbi:MAG: SAM-dependent methyltransferase [Candidatus Krumholzibacteriia bacterium]|jgi:SAM-dependent methyltransferase
MCQNFCLVQAGVHYDNVYCQCTRCSGLFLFPVPKKQPNVVFEGKEGVRRQADLEASRQKYFLRHLVSLENELEKEVPGCRLMEVGCGSGVLLELAQKRGWQGDALELSAELASLASQKNPQSTINVVNVLEFVAEGPAYDAVMAVDVLEHVTDPEQMLANCWQMLKPNGLLLIQTPNTKSLRGRLQGSSWEMRDPAQHLNLFSRQGLHSLLHRTSFEVVSSRTVSGSGMEEGIRLKLALIKQWVLNLAGLGNAHWVVAKKISGK